MSKSALLAAIASAAVLACADGAMPSDPGSRRPALSVSSGEFTFSVDGFTAGPDNEELTPGGCSRETISRDSVAWIDQYDLDDDGSTTDTIGVFIEGGALTTSCTINGNPGGEPYNGGVVYIDGTVNGETKSLDMVEADFTLNSSVFDFPTSGTITLTAQAISGHEFLHWDIFGAVNSRSYASVLSFSGSASANRYTAVFKVLSDGGSPGGGDDPPPSECDDPTAPGCEENPEGD